MILMVNLSIRSRLVFISIGQVKYLSLNEQMRNDKKKKKEKKKTTKKRRRRKKPEEKKMNGCIKDVRRSTR